MFSGNLVQSYMVSKELIGSPREGPSTPARAIKRVVNQLPTQNRTRVMVILMYMVSEKMTTFHKGTKSYLKTIFTYCAEYLHFF